MAAERSNLHVVLLPYLAFGHLIPFHQLAIALAKAGVRVSYISTPKNIHRLPKPPPSLQPLITSVPIPLPVLDSNPLPEGAEATVDIPLEKIQDLTMAFDLLRQPFKEFVSDHSPDWIIIDFFPHWATDVGIECDVPVMIFSAFSAATIVFFGPPEYLSGDGQKRVRSNLDSLTSPPQWVDFPSTVTYKRFEAIGALPGLYGVRNASEISLAARFGKTLEASQAVAIRSCREFEDEYLCLFAKLLGKPVIPVGFLPPEKGEITNGSWIETFKWLDQQRPKSVVFVGFGSECRLTKDEVYEIAFGLEESELPFLWTLRKPNWAVDDLDTLPPGFGRRTSHIGKVCIGWAPQIEILTHPAVGGSLFHAGWGSAIETLQFGHALVVLPFVLDQGLNARFLVEKGLAIEVERSSEDGSFRRNDIAKSLRQAMVAKEGEEMKDRLRNAGTVAGNRELHDRYVGEFVEYLKNEVEKRK
ncbi:hypothetical protein U1Q18_023615 [Sarracenia purpurea var. burkii]